MYTYIPRTTEAAIIPFKELLYVWWTINFWRGQPADSNGTDETAVLGFWMVPVNCDILGGMGFLQFHRCGGEFRWMKNTKFMCPVWKPLPATKKNILKPHKFSTKWRKVMYANYFVFFSACLDFDMLQVCPCSLECVNSWKVQKMQKWQLTRQESRRKVETFFLAETAEIT